MRIDLIEPFFSGSHQQWALELQANSRHKIELKTMKGRFWKWRMRGGAVTLANQVSQDAGSGLPDLFLGTSMLDGAAFRGLLPPELREIPLAIYFHESQFTYPVSAAVSAKQKEWDTHYAFTNITTMLAADQVIFNSNYHRRVFFEESKKLIKTMKDYRFVDLIERAEEGSVVLPCGIDLKLFAPKKQGDSKVPVILWNHRWEYDKNPDQFLGTLRFLKDNEFDFKLILLGEEFQGTPESRKKIVSEFGDKIIHEGFAESREEYLNLLSRSDLVLSFADHDFFGISVVEAIASGATPLLPDRLAYPEHVDPSFLYRSQEELNGKLVELFRTFPNWPKSDRVNSYDWSELAPRFDALLEDVSSR